MSDSAHAVLRPRRVLSMWQPWAQFTVAPSLSSLPGTFWKNVETRHFEPRHVRRGITLPIRVAIHATKRWTADERQFAESVQDLLDDIGYVDPRAWNGHDRPLPLGAIIGVATIVRVVSTTQLLQDWRFGEHDQQPYAGEEVELGNYKPGRFGWLLAEQQDLLEPIAFTGRQDVLYELAPEIDARIDEQLERVAA